ncbi:MAG: hypothetical protein MZV63_47515 [Marinilabiliales bacterium]|nr:hypothetical protein [Marinilabiliales bacterium]
MKDFDGRFIIQTLFVRGECNGETIDNTTPEETDAWLEAIARLEAAVSHDLYHRPRHARWATT